MNIETYGIIIGATIGLGELAKKAILPDQSTNPKKYDIAIRIIPVIIVAIGFVLTALVVGFTKAAIIPGIVNGLTAAGLYSGTKTVAQGSGLSAISTQ